jgi:hypothetical protein
MTEKQLKLIYEYMGWKDEEGESVAEDFKIIVWSGKKKPLDSNSAWECVQEMYQRSDWEDFVNYCWVEDYVTSQNVMFIMNPNSFFECFSKWLENKTEVSS